MGFSGGKLPRRLKRVYKKKAFGRRLAVGCLRYQLQRAQRKKMSDRLEWNARSHYSMTELVLFVLTCLVLFVTLAFSFIYSYLHINHNVSFFSVLRPLFENVLPTAVAFTPVSREDCSATDGGGKEGIATNGGGKEGSATDGTEKDDSATDIHRREADITRTDGRTETDGKRDGEKDPPKVNIVFLGHEERSPNDRSNKESAVRIWVHVYFILLCGLIIVWTISVFSDSVLYRKSSSCNDISLEDKDLSCFLLSNRDIPEGVQEIINEGDGELVPCEDVQNHLVTNNVSYHLEVICYQYQLNPLAALGISYGAMKTIAFVIVSAINVLLAFVDKLFKRNKMDQNNRSQQPRVVGLRSIIGTHIFFFAIALALIAILAIVSAIVHHVAGLRNSGYDYLRGEKFYSFSVVVLAPITLLYVTFIPWWALEPLREPPEVDILNSKNQEEVRTKIRSMVHNILLHQKFSTRYATFFDIVNSDTGKFAGKLAGKFVLKDVLEMDEVVVEKGNDWEEHLNT